MIKMPPDIETVVFQLKKGYNSINHLRIRGENVETFDFRRLEATKLDFKENLETQKPKSWLKSVSAFANTQGGHIVFGVTDRDHEPRGLAAAQEAISRISQLIRDRISPMPGHIITEFDSGIEGRPCIDLEIQDGPHYPYYYVHEGTREAYIRHGDRSEITTDYELNNLILRGQNKTFDALPSHYREADVSFTLFGATYKKETGDELVLPRDLVSMGLLDRDGHVTNAGLLLCDQGYLRQSRIVCTRWKGLTKGSIDGDALDDKEFSDSSLISLLNNAETFVRNNSRNPWTIRGMRREENSDYPYRAVREVLVNAMIHRDYQLKGTEIHVDMYDDHMEIVSPGGMFSGGRIQDMDLHRVPSIRRNEIISDLFGRLHYMDRRGSGISRILNSYLEFVEQPRFYSDAMSFSVVLPNRSVTARGQMEFELQSDSETIEITQSREQKTQSNDRKTQSTGRKLNPKQNYKKSETESFREYITQKSGGAFRTKTIDRIIYLFDKYGYDYSFNRRNIADAFHISENGASGFINKCIQHGIMIRVKVDEYQFGHR